MMLRSVLTLCFTHDHIPVTRNFTEDGKSYLDEKLKSLDIDTVVIVSISAQVLISDLDLGDV